MKKIILALLIIFILTCDKNDYFIIFDILRLKDYNLLISSSEGVYRMDLINNTYIKLNDKHLRTLTVLNDTTILGGSYFGLFESNDEGESWIQLEFPLLYSGTGINFINYDSHLFAITTGGVVYTDEGGPISWKKFYQKEFGVNLFTIFDSTYFIEFFSGKICQYDGTTEKVILEKEIKTNDYSINDMIALKDGLLLLATSKNYILRYNSKTNKLYKSTNGLDDSFIIFIRAYNDRIFAVGKHSIYYSGNQGDSWYRSFKNDGVFIETISGIYGDTLYIGSDKGHIYYSKNNGESWELLCQLK